MYSSCKQQHCAEDSLTPTASFAQREGYTSALRLRRQVYTETALLPYNLHEFGFEGDAVRKACKKSARPGWEVSVDAGYWGIWGNRLADIFPSRVVEDFDCGMEGEIFPECGVQSGMRGRCPIPHNIFSSILSPQSPSDHHFHTAEPNLSQHGKTRIVWRPVSSKEVREPSLNFQQQVLPIVPGLGFSDWCGLSDMK